MVLVAIAMALAMSVVPLQRASADDPVLLPPMTHFLGWNPMSVLVGDVNQDGAQDVLVANYCGSKSCGMIDVMWGKGDGTFHSSQGRYPTGGAYPRTIAFADVNHDGNLDVLVANEESPLDDVEGSIGVLKGKRNGTFEKPVVLDSGGLGAKSVSVGYDVNHDGFHDILVANSNNVAVILGRGDGRFRAPVTYETGGNSIAVADFNGDGNPDLVVAGDSLFVRLGNGNGTFQDKQVIGAGGSFVTTTDMNQDGKTDLLVASYGQSTLSVYFGKGDGTFRPPAVYSTGAQSATSVAVAEINHDGNPDVLVTSICAHGPCPDGGPGQISVFFGNRDGSLQPALVLGTGGNEAWSVGAADMDGDNKNDAVVANASGNVAILLNNIPPRAETQTTLVGDKNPCNLGDTVTFTSTVTSASGRIVSGTVTFWNRGKKMGVEPLSNGEAIFQWTFISGGHKEISAVYSGDYNNLSSVSPTWIENAKPFPVPTQVHVTSSVNPSHPGQAVTFTATVTNDWGTIPDGELVTFVDVSTRTTLGVVPLVNATASITTTALTEVRTHVIRATYAGDPTYSKRSGNIHQVVE